MIPLNIDDPTVLRRTLEDIEERIPVYGRPVSPVEQLAIGADLITTVAKLNELITGFNALVSELAIQDTSQLS